MDRKLWKKRFMRMASCAMAFSMTAATVGVTAGCLFALQGCSKEQEQTQTETPKAKTYTFVFDLNYEGSRNRTNNIREGGMASDYTPARFGWEFDGWFCEKECITPYNFSTPVNKDTTIYALWTDKTTITYRYVTLDYGEGVTTVEEVRDGRVVPTSSALSSQKLGYEIVGWYLDEDYTQEFVLGVTPVSADIILYAKYVRKQDVQYTDDGDFAFNGVQISIAFKDDHDTKSKVWVQTLVEEFNEAYEGQISISVVAEKEKPTLWFDTTSELNAKKSEIYSMEDALEIAGKAFREEEYYSNWINDCYIDGELYSMPIASFVPVIGYSRNLLNQYNGGVEPTDHASLMDLLERVNRGEAGTDGWVSTVTMSNSWDMKQVVTNNFYLQNGLPLYSVMENGALGNQWMKDDASKKKAYDSVEWFRDMFLKYGSMGKITGSVWTDGKNGVDWTWVGMDKSFMGIMGSPNLNSHFGWRTNQTEKTLWTKTVGIMPISYFFAAEGDEESAKRIYVQNYSLAIPKYGNTQSSKVAAAAVFADFASKYCEDACESYLYPANKLAQYNAFNGLTRSWCVDYILAECGNPEDFYTYPGSIYEYNVTVSSQSTFLTNTLCWMDDRASKDDVAETIDAFCNKINKEMFVQ